MPISDHVGGFIKPGYFPLEIPDAPTIGAATSGGSLAISIAFTAPSNVGGGAITSYEAVATDTVTAAIFTASGSSSPITVTGLTDGQSYTVTVSATNAYGPSVLSAASNSYQVVTTLQLWTWGKNNKGQLGVGDLTYYSSPVQVGALTTWSQISVGLVSSFAVKTDHTMWSWGQGQYYGQLGHGNTTNYSSPVQIGALTTWLQVASGMYHTSAVKTDGTLWAWGRNNAGQLGNGESGGAGYSSPIQIGALTTWLKVANSYSSSFGIKTDGTLWAWGKNVEGQLGQENTTNYSSPVQVGALTTWSAVQCGEWNVFATKTDGTLWAWGEGNDGPLGQGNTTDYSSPVQVGALTTWTAQLNGGGSGTTGRCVAIQNDGTAWLWGAANYGALGHNNSTNYSSPVQLGALATWSKITSILKSTAAIKTDGTLWAWGDNTTGELGTGNTTSTSSPVQVGALTTWSDVQKGNGAAHQMAFKQP